MPNMEVLKVIWNFRSTLLLVLLPIGLLPIPLVIKTSAASCGYCIILMSGLWISEVLPLAVTSFFPLVLFPVMGIMTATEVSMTYMNDTSWFIVGGLMIAVGIQHTRLHERIALKVLLLVGSKPHSLMFGFMLTTYLLSMWISNTATTAMMIPIVTGVLEELRKQNLKEITKAVTEEKTESGDDIVTKNIPQGTSFSKKQQANQNNHNSYTNDSYNPNAEEVSVYDLELENTSNQSEDVALVDKMNKSTSTEKGLTLCVPYAASIGGIATLTGASPNALLAGQFSEIFPDASPKITFGNWMAYHLPISFSLFLFAYIWMMWLFLGFDLKIIKNIFKSKSEAEINIKNHLQNQYNKLGAIRWAEVTVLLVLITTVLLWLLRDPGFFCGWSVIFKEDYVTDGTVAMTMAILLFILPSERPAIFCPNSNRPKPVPPVLNWATTHRMFPWHIIFILGGGFALARGSTASGFSAWVGSQLADLGNLPDWVMVLVVSTIVCIFTQCVSNLAATSIFIPIVAELAQATGVNPLYLLLPMVTSSNLAYMLPVATPANAIAFANGDVVEVMDLVKAGWLLCIVGLTLLVFFINTYGNVIYGVDEFPEWASSNYTSAAN